MVSRGINFAFVRSFSEVFFFVNLLCDHILFFFFFNQGPLNKWLKIGHSFEKNIVSLYANFFSWTFYVLMVPIFWLFSQDFSTMWLSLSGHLSIVLHLATLLVCHHLSSQFSFNHSSGHRIFQLLHGVQQSQKVGFYDQKLEKLNFHWKFNRMSDLRRKVIPIWRKFRCLT